MKIAICGFYGKKNFGDELMQDYLSELLCFDDDQDEISVYSDNHVFDSSLAVREIKNGIEDKSYLDADVIVIGGGGIIDPNFWIFRDKGIEKLMGRKVIFLNVSIYRGAVVNKWFMFSLKQLHASWYVRDHASVEMLEESEISATYLPDIIFHRDPSTTAFKCRDIAFNRLSSGSDTIKRAAIYPNAYAFMSKGARTMEYLRAQMAAMNIQAFCDILVREGWEITIVAAQTDRVVNDAVCGALIFNGIADKQKVTWQSAALSYQEHIELIQSQNLIVSMRFHSSLAAIKYGIPCIDIIHHDKNRTAWTDARFIDNLLDYHCFNEKSLTDAKAFLDKNEGDYKSATKIYSDAAKTLWLKSIEELKKITNH